MTKLWLPDLRNFSFFGNAVPRFATRKACSISHIGLPRLFQSDRLHIHTRSDILDLESDDIAAEMREKLMIASTRGGRLTDGRRRREGLLILLSQIYDAVRLKAPDLGSRG